MVLSEKYIYTHKTRRPVVVYILTAIVCSAQTPPPPHTHLPIYALFISYPHRIPRTSAEHILPAIAILLRPRIYIVFNVKPIV